MLPHKLRPIMVYSFPLNISLDLSKDLLPTCFVMDSLQGKNWMEWQIKCVFYLMLDSQQKPSWGNWAISPGIELLILYLTFPSAFHVDITAPGEESALLAETRIINDVRVVQLWWEYLNRWKAWANILWWGSPTVT